MRALSEAAAIAGKRVYARRCGKLKLGGALEGRMGAAEARERVELALRYLEEGKALVERDPVQASEKLYKAAEEAVRALALYYDLGARSRRLRGGAGGPSRSSRKRRERSRGEWGSGS